MIAQENTSLLISCVAARGLKTKATKTVIIPRKKKLVYYEISIITSFGVSIIYCSNEIESEAACQIFLSYLPTIKAMVRYLLCGVITKSRG